MHTDGA